MDDYKYMWLSFGIIPKEIIYEYNLTGIAHNGKFYIDIRNGMRGIPQAGKISHARFKKHLKKHGCQPIKFTLLLWTHKSRPISFILIVGVKSVWALLYYILKYYFKKYFEFGSVSPFCIWRENNICSWVYSIQSVINGQ